MYMRKELCYCTDTKVLSLRLKQDEEMVLHWILLSVSNRHKMNGKTENETR